MKCAGPGTLTVMDTIFCTTSPESLSVQLNVPFTLILNVTVPVSLVVADTVTMVELEIVI